MDYILQKSGAAIVVEELIRQGVDVVFGYPGGYVINIYDELYKNSDKIKHVLTAHEQGAAHAADAYARVSDTTSAVIATGGPGATNLVTGIANAYLDSVPVVFITGNVPTPMRGGDSFQEIDTVGVTMPIVKHSFIVRDVQELRRTLAEAFMIAGSGRKGPVLVDIPKSVQLACAENDELPARPEKGSGSGVYTGSLDDALDALRDSSRPYIYCGGGVISSGTGGDVLRLSGKLGAPVGASMMGIGAVPDSYELSLGMSGMHGRYGSTVAMAEADLILALGVRFSDRATGNAREYGKNAKIIHIDIDAAEIGKNVRPDVSLCGDLRIILPELAERCGGVTPNASWLSKVAELKSADAEVAAGGFTPRDIIRLVNGMHDSSTIVATDVGQHQMWVAQHYRFEQPRKFITSGGLGAMGFGLGAAIGACIACGRKRTILFTSDGSFGMNLTELATAVAQILPITIVLLNNGVLGMLRQWQALFLEGRYSATTLDRKTDFPALAKAFGAAGFAVSCINELEAALLAAPDAGPSLIDCSIDMDEKVYPMIPDGGTLADMLY